MINDAKSGRGHAASRLIKASPSVVFRAFMEDLVHWLPPEGAVGQLDVCLSHAKEGGSACVCHSRRRRRDLLDSFL
ncbi:MAG: hypothetical protein JWO64_2399 [Hyphomicrobiales bacterium]|nr:hypothetical protein [Hyphomicrobiales bacterium]